MANPTWSGDNQTDDWSDVSNKADMLTGSMSGGKFGPNLKNMIGLCAGCQYYCYVINDMHQLVYSVCGKFQIFLKTNDKIKDCSQYKERNSMSLTTMYEIATLIDVPQNANIGFTVKRK